MKATLIILFLQFNYETLAGLVLGGFAGYLYWERFGLLWGTYPLSAECWVSCVIGSLTGGFIASLLFNERYVQKK